MGKRSNLTMIFYIEAEACFTCMHVYNLDLLVHKSVATFSLSGNYRTEFIQFHPEKQDEENSYFYIQNLEKIHGNVLHIKYLIC
jgi:hypothetical protein